LEEENIKNIIAKNMATLRLEAGFKSQGAFGKEIGVSKTSVWNYENGVNFFPLEKLPTVIKVLKCSIEDIFSPLFDDKYEDEEFRLIVEKLKKIYKLPNGKEEIKKELHKIELLFEEQKIPSEGKQAQR